MMKISIPPELGITAPEHMPFVELVKQLHAKGYTLANKDGDLVAVPITRVTDLDPETLARARDMYQASLNDDYPYPF